MTEQAYNRRSTAALITSPCPSPHATTGGSSRMASYKPIPNLTARQRSLFASKLRLLSSGCIVWTGALQPSGYGQVRLFGKSFRVHRVAYALEHGQIPPDMVLDHRCHNRACVNPEHLIPTTHEENLRSVAPAEVRHRVPTGRCVQCSAKSETYRCERCRKSHNAKDRPSQRKSTRKNH